MGFPILVTNDQNCWKTQSGKLVGLTPFWGSVMMIIYYNGLRRWWWWLSIIYVVVFAGDDDDDYLLHWSSQVMMMMIIYYNGLHRCWWWLLSFTMFITGCDDGDDDYLLSMLVFAGPIFLSTFLSRCAEWKALIERKFNTWLIINCHLTLISSHIGAQLNFRLNSCWNLRKYLETLGFVLIYAHFLWK